MKKLRKLLLLIPLALLAYGCKKKDVKTTSKKDNTIITTKTNGNTTSNTTKTKQYQIEFYDYNGSILCTTITNEGEIPVYTGLPPKRTKAGYEYKFIGWDKEIVAATSNESYKAQYSSTLLNYDITYILNDGINDEDNPLTYNVEMDDIVLKSPSKEGYNFMGWRENNESIDTINTSLARPVTVEATWSICSYNVTVDKNIDVAGSIKGIGMYEYNSEVTIEIETNKGFTFDGLYNGSEFITLDETYTFTIGTDNVELNAKWHYNEYDLELTNSNEAYGSITGSGTYEYNSEVTIIATPNTGYNFLGWYENGNLVNNSGTFKFNMPYENKTYEARWSINKYSVAIITNIENAGKLTGDGEYDYNSNVTLTATTYTGYTFLGWYNGEEELETESTYSFTMPHENLEILAKYKYNSYTLTVNKNIDAAGTVTASGVHNYREQITLTATVNPGYSFQYWSYGTYQTDYNNEITITMPAYDATYEAVYRANKYQVTTSKNINDNAITVSSGAYYDYNSEVTVITTCSEIGYNFVGWKVDGSIISTDESYTFNLGLGNIKLEATYEYNSYSFDAAGDGVSGYIKSDLADSYLFKDKIVLEVNTYPGYTFDGWYIGTSLLSPNSKYTYTMPHNDVSINAVWHINTYTLTIDTATPYCEVTGAGEKEYMSAVTVSAVVYKGFEFNGWYKDNNLMSESLSFTFEMPSDNVTLTADFRVNDEMQNFYFTATVDNCFITGAKNTTMYSIVVPEYVSQISKGSFKGCSNVSYIKLPSRVLYYNGYSRELGYFFGTSSSSFNGCYAAGDYYIPNNLTYVYIYAEENYTNYDKLADKFLYKCTSVETFRLPSCIKSIGTDAFTGCTNLDDVYYDGMIEDWCKITFDGKKSNPMYFANNFSSKEEDDTSIIVPNTITTIGSYQFYGFKHVKRIEIPSTVTSIGTGAFGATRSLEYIKLPFAGRTSTTGTFHVLFGTESVSGCQSVEVDSYNTYYLPSYLETIEIFNCTSIIDDAFKKITSLKNIVLSTSIKTINSSAFNGCTNLESTFYKGTVSDWCKITFSSKLSNPMYYADDFYTLGEEGFKSFEGYNYSSESSFVIDNTVTKIGKYQFFGFGQLISIVLPETVTDIAYYAFANTGLQYLKVPTIGSKSAAEPSFYDWFYTEEYAGGTKIGDYYLPTNLNTIEIFGCTTIPASAFSNCKLLDSVILSSSITSIGSSAFASCTGLDTVYYEGTIEDWCNISFESNSSSNPMSYATKFYLRDENGSVVESFTSKTYTYITELIIPNTITTINTFNFQGFSQLTKVVVPKSVTLIKTSAFRGCYSIDTLSLPFVGDKRLDEMDTAYLGMIFGETEYDESYKAGSYYIPNALRKVIITDSVIIPKYAFYGLTKVTTIVLPEVVSQIGNYAFKNCNNLEKVYYEGSAVFFDSIIVAMEYNDGLNASTLYYYSDEEQTSGNYWHYVDGEIVEW